MIIITNPHFSQYRVSRDSLPTQSSNLDYDPVQAIRPVYWFQNGGDKVVKIAEQLQGDISNQGFKIKRPLLLKSYPKLSHIFAIFRRTKNLTLSSQIL